jgi:hypothetical protein
VSRGAHVALERQRVAFTTICALHIRWVIKRFTARGAVPRKEGQVRSALREHGRWKVE